jgi:hypothetical protein
MNNCPKIQPSVKFPLGYTRVRVVRNATTHSQTPTFVIDWPLNEWVSYDSLAVFTASWFAAGWGRSLPGLICLPDGGAGEESAARVWWVGMV